MHACKCTFFMRNSILLVRVVSLSIDVHQYIAYLYIECIVS